MSDLTALAGVVGDSVDRWANRGHLILPGPVDLAPSLAKAIAHDALTAGWRPPARRIETPEQLDALPDGTVILDANEEFHRLNPYGMNEPRTWYPAWLTGNAYATDFGQDPELPAVVLWEPEQEAGE